MHLTTSCLSCGLPPQPPPLLGQLLILHILRRIQYQVLHGFVTIHITKAPCQLLVWNIWSHSSPLINPVTEQPLVAVLWDSRQSLVNALKETWVPISAWPSHWLCNLRQVNSPLWASVSPSVKWAQLYIYTGGLFMKTKCDRVANILSTLFGTQLTLRK